MMEVPFSRHLQPSRSSLRQPSSLSTTSSESWWLVGPLAFAAGVTLSSMVHYYYYYYYHNHPSLLRRDNAPTKEDFKKDDANSVDETAVNNQQPQAQPPPPPLLQRKQSLLQRIMMVQQSEDTTTTATNHSRIGELPEEQRRKKTTRWPWDRLKRTDTPPVVSTNSNVIDDTAAAMLSASTSSLNNEALDNSNPVIDTTNTNPSSDDHSSHDDRPDDDDHDTKLNDHDKSSLCIGSIFGLDVGGTLAKLCYFESSTIASATITPRTSAVDSPASAANGAAHRLQPQHHPRRRRVTMHHPYEFYMGPPSNPRRQRMSGSDDENNGSGSCQRRQRHIVPQRRRSHSMSSTSSSSSSGTNWAHNNNNEETPLTTTVQQHRDDDDDHNHPAEQSSSSQESFLPRRSLPWRQQSVTEDDILPAHLRTPQASSPTADERDATAVRGTTTTKIAASPPLPTKSVSTMRKARSMFEFKSVMMNGTSCVLHEWDDHHAEALDRFYSFARRLDSYREGLRDHHLSFRSNELGGEFHFIRFETRKMQNAMDLIRTHKLHLNIHEMGATGGGAHKFATLWQQELGIVMKKQDELDSLVAGMQFVLSTVVGECYTFRPPRDDSNNNNKKSNKKKGGDFDYGNYFGIPLSDDDDGESRDGHAVSEDEARLESEDRCQGDEWWWSRKVQRDTISYSSTYPYLVVTIGTGVSVLRVDGPRQYERVSGSTIGGGTYLGLIRLLTDVEDFDDVMRLAERGDPTKVDMMVGDIYGENSDALEKLGLPSNIVASSFGKLMAKEDPAAGLKQEDLARALLLMITNNIGQVAILNAKLFKTPRIYFVGNFLRHNKISQRRLSYAIDYWSKGEMEALFLEHEGYFGALGAFLLAQEISITTETERKYQQQQQKHPLRSPSEEEKEYVAQTRASASEE